MIIRAIGIVLLGMVLLVAALGDRVAPNDAQTQFADHAWAPPMALRGLPGSAYAHPLKLNDRLSRQFAEDRERRMNVSFVTGGRLIAATGPEPLLVLGGDALGRDLYARLAGAARWSLGVALAGALLSVALGALFGGIAAAGSQRLDRVILAAANALAALPIIYVVLILRASLPLVLTPGQVFVTLALFFAAVGWPMPTRGVRGILIRERELDHTCAARAAGATRRRILFVHLLPACSGYLLAQFLLLVPGFLMTEVTMSFLGLGFPEPTPSWGTMLQDAANIRVIAEAPWMLAPAGAIALTSIAMHLAAGGGRDQLTVFSRAR